MPQDSAARARIADEEAETAEEESDASDSGSDSNASDALRPTKSEEMQEMQAERVRATFNAPARWMILAGMMLAACAGMLNVSMSLEIGAVVTHVTGHVTAIGLRLEGLRIHTLALRNMSDIDDHTGSMLTESTLDIHIDKIQQALTVLLSFIFGSFLCGLIIPKNALKFGGKSFYGIALLGNSALILLGFMAMQNDMLLMAEALTACASGLQNAMCTMHLGAVVRTTHVTGTSTDIGSTLGRASMILLRRGCKRRKMTAVERAEVDVDLDKMSVLLAILLSFLFGCFLGALLYSHIGCYTLFVPAAITGTMGVLYTCFRENLKRALKRREVQMLADELHDVEEMLGKSKAAREASGGRSGSSTPRGAGERLREDDMDHVLEMLHDLQEAVHELVEQSPAVSHEGSTPTREKSRHSVRSGRAAA